MAYDPRVSVAAFLAKYGEFGQMVLDAFNTVDPFNCYFGDDVNPDEYLGYTDRFIEKTKLLKQQERSQPTTVERLVRESFHAEQLSGGWVIDAQIKEIAQRISLAGL